MILVIDVVADYCQSKNLPMSSEKEISAIGTKVRHHFNFIYVQKSGLRGYIEGTGFFRVKEGKFAIVVNAYPDDFRPEIIFVIEKYFSDKKAKLEAEEVKKRVAAELSLKPKRPRIPAKKPLYSGK